MIKIAEIKRGTHIVPGLVTGECKIKLRGPNTEITEVVKEIEAVIEKYSNSLDRDDTPRQVACSECKIILEQARKDALIDLNQTDKKLAEMQAEGARASEQVEFVLRGKDRRIKILSAAINQITQNV